MTQPHEFLLDLSEQFENLPHAPIVEAVIQFRARAVKNLEQDTFLQELNAKLPNYCEPQTQYQIEMQTEISPGSSTSQQQATWHGFRFETADKVHVAQFTRNGFAFSRLRPYEDWEQFEAEAQRLWNIYKELAEPSEVQRLGVRFINQISPVQSEQLRALLTIPPKSPKEMQMPIRGLMHQTTFDIPGHAYNLNVIQTIQPPSPPQTEGFGLILDIDVFTTQALEPNKEKLKQRLAEMRWIKNKAFFTFLTKNALKQFKEQPV